MLKALIFTCLVGHVLSQCPHERSGLKRWSEDSTWGIAGKPNTLSDVQISEAILLDESVEMHDITIANTGSLVFDPEQDLTVRVNNIFVEGSFEIGSEECPYTGRLTITLTGNRESHVGESEPKVILVKGGGTIEIHGEHKLSWTKLDQTLLAANENENIYFDHSRIEGNNEHNSWASGITAYTFAMENGVPVQKQFGVYDLHWHSTFIQQHLNTVQEGAIIVMASQKTIRHPEGSTKVPPVYDALEMLVYGEVTNNTLLRQVDTEGMTWALVYQKGNKHSLVEVMNPSGVSSFARYEIGGFVFSGEAFGNPRIVMQTDNIRIGTRDDIYPKLVLADDVTSWIPGDRIAIASTDYDYTQAEEADIILCKADDCSNREIRIKDVIKFTHFGEILRGAVDMRAEVAVLSRRVVIEGEMDPECPEFNGNCDDSQVHGLDTFGAHIKILNGYANARIENVELRNVGQQTDAGRYPIHFHLCLEKIESAAVPYVKGCSIHHSFGRCLTIHGTHGVLVKDNSCYEQMGHGYFLEDGGEKYNVFDGNLAMSTRKGTGLLEPMDLKRPASFWMTNPLTYFTNNVAAGGEGTGIWFVYPNMPLPPSREFNLMDELEASRTMISDFYNNVGHSYGSFGIMIGGKLDDDRTTHCCNMWQPLANPKDDESEPLMIPLDKITCYKNQFNNLWIEGGLLNVTHISVADSANGMIISNEGQQGRFGGRVSHAVVIGESINKGVPTEGFNRSLPFTHDTDSVQSGVTMWKGPTKFNHMWFDSFQSNSHYDIAAIAKKRSSPYFFSILNSFENTHFAFDDAPGEGTYMISGTKDLPGWEKNKDGELISGATFIRTGFQGEEELMYVVKPDPLSAAGADCMLRANWRMAICGTKYGNLRVMGDFDDRHAVFVRDDVPSAQLEFEMKVNTGPQVVMDGSVTYTVHFPQSMGDWIKLFVPGLDKGDTLRVGVCTPLGAEVEIQTFHPYRLNARSKLTRVKSLAELDAEDAALDGKKYYFDEPTGMIYFKLINTETRNPDETNTCNNRKCPEFRVRVLSGNYNDSDCRQRLYTAAELAMPTPTLPEYTNIFPATGSSTPPSDYGAGSTRPFNSRAPVDGGFSDWSDWSACSRKCDEGEKYRTRQCNDPLPENGGASCNGDSVETQTCLVKYCPINGALSEWSEWSTCADVDRDLDPATCSGMSQRIRECNNPPTQYGGRYCEGMVNEIRPCPITCPVVMTVFQNWLD